jgi:hypothetical protein
LSLTQPRAAQRLLESAHDLRSKSSDRATRYDTARSD